MGHPGHAAMYVIAVCVAVTVIRTVGAERVVARHTGTAQAVVLLSRLDQTGFIISVIARPSAVCSLMAHPLEVTNQIIYILLGVVPHRLWIVELRGSNEGEIAVVTVGRVEPKRRLGNMLTPFGLDQ